MTHKSTKHTAVEVGTKPFIIVDPNLPSFEGHPFFEKKAEEARKLLKKIGLPKQLNKKRK